MSQLVLASQSPRRQELLAYLGIPFVCQPADIDENLKTSNPKELVEVLAEKKATKVFQALSSKLPSLLVVGSDTTVYCEKKIFEKPQNIDDAREMLMFLAGKKHQVYTGVHMLYDKHSLSFVECSEVTFRPYHSAVIEKYLETGDSLDKAGAYGIQGPSLTFIQHLEGSYSNVVGFPVDRFIWECELKWGSLYQLCADSQERII